MKVKRFDSGAGNVWKYVFHIPGAITESVLYRYPAFEKRTVICCSVQSGCPVGCKFCGTGKRFLRNLTANEIIGQVEYILMDQKISVQRIEKFQIMFMSMGEPFLNYDNVECAIRRLHKKYPDAQLLISTIAPRAKESFRKFMMLSKDIDEIGLQFSIHKSTDEERNRLIPFADKLSLEDIRDYGIEWWTETGRKPYCNYCVDGKNHSNADFERMRSLFPPNVFCFTFSVVCAKDETLKDGAFRNLDTINRFRQKFVETGYDTRVFDPAGQDDIGGGCGQLWYVQDYLKKVKSQVRIPQISNTNKNI